MTTRIIGGSAGGRRLRTLRGSLTRPTTDRVREALFSSLDSALGSLEGLRFLDLYAGSGAVGLEARSRGGAAVLLVERDKRAAGLITDNARALGLDVDVAQAPVARHLADTATSAYDVVFADPPYDMSGDQVTKNLDALAGNGWLAPGALVVVERSRRSDALRWPEGYEPLRERTYGETALAFGRWTGTAGSLWYGRDQPSAEEP